MKLNSFIFVQTDEEEKLFYSEQCRALSLLPTAY